MDKEGFYAITRDVCSHKISKGTHIYSSWVKFLVADQKLLWNSRGCQQTSSQKQCMKKQQPQLAFHPKPYIHSEWVLSSELLEIAQLVFLWT
jgi:hypothetical protein